MQSQLPVSRNVVKAMTNEFLTLDVNGDGQISTAEIEKVLQSMRGILKVSDGEIRSSVRSMDRNGDGIISLREYQNTRGNSKNRELIYRALVLRSEIRREFRAIDADKNGSISKEELLKSIKERGVISPDQIDEFLKETDVDGNGEIDFEEFVAIMSK